VKVFLNQAHRQFPQAARARLEVTLRPRYSAGELRVKVKAGRSGEMAGGWLRGMPF
jgi:hypothetical protein